MKKTSSLLLLCLIALFPNIKAQEKSISFQSTIPVDKSDTHETIIAKAAHVIPTPNQYNALKNEFIAFIHFGPNTFTRMEWGNGMEDPRIFDLKELDTDQWCEALKAAGMKKVILTVKHHDGFVLWQSRYTKHGIMSTGFQNGKGDILKNLSESCRKYGLKLGVYLSPADLYQIESPEGLYGNLSKYTKRTIPREVAGRPFSNKTTFEFEVDDYNEYFLNQLFEILSEYGPVHEVWFDGAHPKRKGGQTYNYAAWKKLIRTLAPEAVIFGKEDIRWCGNEAGGTRNTEWNVIPYAEDPNTMNNFADLTDKDLGSRSQLYKGNYLHYQPAETNTSIREGWFYRDDTHQKVRTADDVFDIYERAVGGNSTFLLNIPPNRDGKFSPQDVEVLKETGKRIRETYTVNLLKGATGSPQVLDNNEETFVTIENPNQEIIITTPSAVTINRILIQEAIRTNGERVEKHIVDAWINGAWKEIAQATNIGYKRILRFPDVTTNKIRIRFPESRLTPAISNVTAHYYKSRPPQLTLSRTIDGLLTIKPLEPDFNWNPHGENSLENLNKGFQIYYTTDGKEPGTTSNVYTKPFFMGQGILKAVAILNNEKGSVLQQQTGFVKKDWRLVSATDKDSKAFDENPGTYWTSTGSDKSSITIDLGQKQTINGFAYTPPKNKPAGMISKGTIKVSDDNKTWKKAGTFEFGNLINDPTKRYFRFDKPVTGQYVRIEAIDITEKADAFIVAEIDIF